MPSLPVFDKSGKKVGTYDIEPSLIATNINRQLLHDAVVMYRANLRQGSFASKSRAQVSGSTRKMYRQKGTGNARAGSRRSGIRRGGGHIFAKRPRDFSYRLPKKALRLATRMAIASKIADDQITVIEDLSFKQPRTKEMAEILTALGLTGQSILVTTAAYDANVYKSARNIDRVTISHACELNAMSVLTPKRLLVTRAALDEVTRSAAENGSKNQKN